MSTTGNETPVVEARQAGSMLRKVKLLLEKAEHILGMREEELTPDLRAEASAINVRVAELIAKYGIDRAMLAANQVQPDAIVDQVVFVSRPFAKEMMHLLFNVAYSYRAKTRSIKQWNPMSGPKARGGVPKGGWDYGLRIFAYQSDMERIMLVYTSARNQALAGAKKIVDRNTEFGQRQKAERESYLQGFRSAVFSRLQKAEREAREAAEAEQQERTDRAMMAGRSRSAGPGVEMVLADRGKALELAVDTAYGITAEDRARWAKEAQEYRDKVASGEIKAPKSRGRKIKVYDRKGRQFWQGYEDGQKADLGLTPEVMEHSDVEEIGAGEKQ